MNLATYYKKAIEVYKQAVLDTDYKILIEILQKENVPRDVSTYLIILIPIAFTRIICGELNIDFLDEYEEHLQDGKINKSFLSGNDIYYKIYELSNDFIKKSRQDDRQGVHE